jgi:hypothetical protein
VVGLGADHAGKEFARLRLKEHGSSGENLFRHAPEAFQPHESPLVDLSHQHAELVHVGEEHHPGRLCVRAVETGDHVARAVRLDLVRKRAERVFQKAHHALFPA